MAVSYVASAGKNEAGPTTSCTVTIPASVQSGDDLYLCVTNRGATGSDPTVTDDDTGGNTWTKVSDDGGNIQASIWHKKATSGTASKTITVSDCTDSCSAGLDVYRGAGTATDFSVESNASGDETHAGFTPSNADSFICLAVFNIANDLGSSSQTCTDPGVLTERFDELSWGGNDCAVMLATALQSGGPTATGNFTWSQTNADTVSIVFSIPPSGGGMSMSVAMHGRCQQEMS